MPTNLLDKGTKLLISDHNVPKKQSFGLQYMIAEQIMRQKARDKMQQISMEGPTLCCPGRRYTLTKGSIEPITSALGRF
jgi:hypothetical protein